MYAIRSYYAFFLLAVVLSIILLSPSCGKENTDTTEIPYVYVNFSIDPSSIQYGNLNIPGNYAYVKGGYRGIIIYHYTQDEYLAFERTCTYDRITSYNVCYTKLLRIV